MTDFTPVGKDSLTQTAADLASAYMPGWSDTEVGRSPWRQVEAQRLTGAGKISEPLSGQGPH